VETKFIPRTSNLIAFGAGSLEQIDKEIIKSQHLHAEHKERVANLILRGQSNFEWRLPCGSDGRTSEPQM
jgi:hypothetical protein